MTTTKIQKYVYEFSGTVTPQPKNKTDVPVPYAETFYVVASSPEDATIMLQKDNPRVTDLTKTPMTPVKCNQYW